ncbi:BIRC1 [Mytilus edulis]|uniref:NAIP n=1 Tax=Mytilus edulis TaxID=6550 RepID=A0A8S3QX40_MYTED|nr:BIRC1 [Mytilus edulis]
MDKIQKYSQNRQFCLGDMFASRIRYIKRIDFLRLYGVEHFDIKELKLHSQMEKHVTGVFYKLINKLNEETYWWYHYRRNALRPVGSNEDTFRLMKQVFQDGEPVIVFQKFKTYESRLATFSEYPVGNQSFKENMAHAGFFYFNVADYVQCFSCGGCLYKWSKTHKPEKKTQSLF